MSRKSYPSDVSDEEWEFVMPYLCLMVPEAPQRQHDLNASMIYARCSMLCGGWCEAGHPGATCRVIFLAGTRCISRRNAGSTRRCSRRWRMIFGRCFERPKAKRLIQARSSSTRVWCKAPPKAGTGRASMFIKRARAPRKPSKTFTSSPSSLSCSKTASTKSITRSKACLMRSASN